MPEVSQLFIYPIKSLGGIELSEAFVTERGFQYDRRWMLVNQEGEFMTQRAIPEMALFQTAVFSDHLAVTHKKKNLSINIPFLPSEQTMMVQVWSDRCRARIVSTEVSEWFSDLLSIKCNLVFMPETTRRRVDGRYARDKEITSFSDAYPFLLVGQSSLDDLNSRLKEAVPMNRFRPNIVVKNSASFEEDEWAHFSISSVDFWGVKLCARCVITTIDQEKAKKNKEPLKTLATYRMRNRNIYFGQNLLHKGEGLIKIGDQLEIKERKNSRFSGVQF